jgi:anti-sigma regulatory factor (Ser/Thr protein kinase)
MPSRHIDLFVLAVHEAAANAVRHGGGTGQLLLGLQAGQLLAEIIDRGPGIPEGRRAIPATPGTSVHDGRGLWLITQVSTDLQIDTGDTGTRLLLRYSLDSPGPGSR